MRIGLVAALAVLCTSAAFARPPQALYAYVEGVEAFRHQEWRKASRLLKQAIDSGILPPEHFAIAQQDLIIAQFSLARVADEIRAIQEARRDQAQDYLRRRIVPADAEAYPASSGAGNRISFTARVVDVQNGVLYVGTQQQGSTVRDVPAQDGVYAVVTPRPLPSDPRVARGALVSVQGRLESPSYGTRATVRADFLSFRNERGLAGPLRVDFLNFNDEQRANLD